MADATPTSASKASVNNAFGPGTTTPKLVKTKAVAPFSVGSPNVAFGCEHIEEIFKTGGETPWKAFVSFYLRILQILRDEHPIVTQSFKDNKTTHVTIRPTWLCVHCPMILSEDLRKQHWIQKEHCFFVNSRGGYLYCSSCEDFVFDPTLEPLRMMNGSRKRKFDEFSNPEDYRTIPGNSSHTPCRAIGLRGLYNMGNTCFMSVIIQTLLHNPLIRSYYLSNGHNSTDCKIEYCVSCALDEIFTEFYTTEKTEGFGAVTMLMNTWKTAEAMNNGLAGYHQQDAHEYMQFLLNALHTANGGLPHGPNCNCVVHKTFYGRLQSVVTCDKCNNRTVAVDPFMDLSLDLRSQVKSKLTGDKKKDSSGNKDDGATVMKLEECLRRFTSSEKLPAAEYTCRKCDAQRDATKQFGILTLPPCLCIHLKRFSHSNDKSSKLGTPVKFPLTLDVLPYTTLYVSPETLPKSDGSTAASGSTPSKPKANSTNGTTNPYEALLAMPREYWDPTMLTYALSAVVVHKGEINSGHYVNYARKGTDWFLFDDSKVVLADEAEVLAAEAYLLVYVIEDMGPWAEQEKAPEVDADDDDD